nr:TIGR01440 family protein [Gorillibacterium massiliense]
MIPGNVEQILTELVTAGGIGPRQMIVIGVSTSEVAGRRIGSAGSREVAEAIFKGVRQAREKFGFFPVFQCCEHLNRALVVERELLALHPDLTPVSVVPVPKAGGSMAATAYLRFQEPVVVEEVRAHAGLDIGSTLIGMHMRPVAVPVRPTLRRIGEAAVTMAYSRPKLIGGSRAVYDDHAAREAAGTCD